MLQIEKDLLLRRLVNDDAPALFALVESNRLRLRQWLPWLDRNTKVADSLSFIQVAQKEFDAGKSSVLGISFKMQLIGIASLHFIDKQNKRASIGYWIDQGYTGHGFVKKAIARLIEHAFNDLQLHRLEIRCATKNVDSQRIPEKLGFQLEGIARDCEWLYDHYVDHKVYALLSD